MTSKTLSASRLPRAALFTLFAGVAGVSALAGCYGVDFDEAISGAYYCQSDSECLETQACSQFRCVDDVGPALTLTLPEPLTPFDPSTTMLTVNFEAQGLTLIESTSRVEGEGQVAIFIDGDHLATTDIAGAQLPLPADILPGAHQMRIQAQYGDGGAYTNPSATDFTTFYISDGARPQVAIVSPVHGHTHVLGEDLLVESAVRNFTYVENGSDCTWSAGCDPFAEAAACEQITGDCTSAGEPNNDGHSHAYLLDDYPECLTDPVLPCNGSYALSMRLSDNIPGDADEVSGLIPGDRFDTVGEVTLTVTLQYNNHEPFPNNEFVIFSQITINVVEP